MKVSELREPGPNGKWLCGYCLQHHKGPPPSPRTVFWARAIFGGVVVLILWASI